MRGCGPDGLPVLEDLTGGSDLGGLRALVRVDMNVPLAKDDSGNQRVADDFRIRAAVPTLEWLTARGVHVVACTHLGRPGGTRDPRFELAPVRERLGQVLPGIELMENLRFYPGEAADDEAFVLDLVAGKDLYVNDAFGSCHRNHASIVGPPRYLPSAAGRLVEREVRELSGLLDSPAWPFVVVLGGAKVADKLGLVASLSERADRVLVGGGMAFTFTESLGFPAGGSIVDRERLAECRTLLARRANITLPVDFVTAGGPGGDEVGVSGLTISDGRRGLDIGPATTEEFCEAIKGAGTVLWNGPMGVFEDPRFAAGTRAIAGAVASCPGHSVIGGGDSAAAVHELGMGGQVDYISTGGGAALELLEHGDLPGLRALRENSRVLSTR
ncbi:MAG: phosphoglycerate kinase [Acidimicrobiales bacterium]